LKSPESCRRTISAPPAASTAPASAAPHEPRREGGRLAPAEELGLPPDPLDYLPHKELDEGVLPQYGVLDVLPSVVPVDGVAVCPAHVCAGAREERQAGELQHGAALVLEGLGRVRQQLVHQLPLAVLLPAEEFERGLLRRREAAGLVGAYQRLGQLLGVRRQLGLHALVFLAPKLHDLFLVLQGLPQILGDDGVAAPLLVDAPHHRRRSGEELLLAE
jgi:hypothetical protein